MPPPSGLPVDACGCWHSGFQDFSLSARYRFGDETRAITPVVRYVRPSHDYRYAGEAVLGRRLQETQIGINAGLRLKAFCATPASKRATPIRSSKSRSVTFRSTGAMASDAGYALTSRLYIHGIASWQQTDGGLPDRVTYRRSVLSTWGVEHSGTIRTRDRLLAPSTGRLAAELAYSAGPIDFLFRSRNTSGEETHTTVRHIPSVRRGISTCRSDAEPPRIRTISIRGDRGKTREPNYTRDHAVRLARTRVGTHRVRPAPVTPSRNVCRSRNRRSRIAVPRADRSTRIVTSVQPRSKCRTHSVRPYPEPGRASFEHALRAERRHRATSNAFSASAGRGSPGMRFAARLR